MNKNVNKNIIQLLADDNLFLLFFRQPKSTKSSTKVLKRQP